MNHEGYGEHGNKPIPKGWHELIVFLAGCSAISLPAVAQGL